MIINSIYYYFGRLNIISAYSNKYDFIYNSLRKGIHKTIRDYDWGFFEIKKLFIDDYEFFTGYVVKYKPFKDEDVVDEENRMLTTTTVPNRAIAFSIFFVHPKSGIIAYHPITGKIGSNQFKKIFSQLIEAANDNLFVDAEIQAIDEETKIIEAIKNFDKINSLYIELHPSNPSNRKIWEDTDEKIKLMQAEKYKQNYISRKGLLIDKNHSAFGDIIMAVDGYGRADIYGEKDGKEHTASTDKNPLKVKGIKDDDPKKALKSIIDTFKKVFNRVK